MNLKIIKKELMLMLELKYQDLFMKILMGTASGSLMGQPAWSEKLNKI